jgi:putative flippase GtrA
VLFDAVRDGFEYETCDWRAAMAKNPTLVRSATQPPQREAFFEDLEANGYDWLARRYLSTPKTVVRKASRIIGGKLDGLVRGGVGAGMKLFHIKPTETMQDKLTQFVKFCMVGVTNVIVSYSVNVLTLLLVNRIWPGLKYDYVIANTVAFLVAVYWSFYWNSRKVFHFTTKDKALRRRALFRSYLCYGFTGIILNNALSTLWIKGLGISKFISPLLNLLFTIPINYLTNKKWAFATKKDRN